MEPKLYKGKEAHQLTRYFYSRGPWAHPGANVVARAREVHERIAVHVRKRFTGPRVERRRLTLIFLPPGGFVRVRIGHCSHLRHCRILVLSMVAIVAAVAQAPVERPAPATGIARLIVFWVKAAACVFATLVTVDAIATALLAWVKDSLATAALLADLFVVRRQERAETFTVGEQPRGFGHRSSPPMLPVNGKILPLEYPRFNLVARLILFPGNLGERQPDDMSKRRNPLLDSQDIRPIVAVLSDSLALHPREGVPAVRPDLDRGHLVEHAPLQRVLDRQEFGDIVRAARQNPRGQHNPVGIRDECGHLPPRQRPLFVPFASAVCIQNFRRHRSSHHARPRSRACFSIPPEQDLGSDPLSALCVSEGACGAEGHVTTGWGG